MPQNPQDNLDAMLVVVTSLPNVEAAKGLARALVEKNLAACVQLTEGISSIYRWEDKICEEQEVLLSAKTAGVKWLEISNFIKGAHPYDVSEILAFTPTQYDEQYGKWVQSEVNSKS
jgi:periplasmic divalent cation tolerance protein